MLLPAAQAGAFIIMIIYLARCFIRSEIAATINVNRPRNGAETIHSTCPAAAEQHRRRATQHDCYLRFYAHRYSPLSG